MNIYVQDMVPIAISIAKGKEIEERGLGLKEQNQSNYNMV